ncbi:MAG: COX15/CtaA family protein [Paracoccaceae bacterium]|nr:COX15/CtaA family protein [Paracoccaceae bacterium]
MAVKRSIFEEVGAKPATGSQGGMIDAKGRGARGAIRIWLGAIFLLVMGMIFLGGLTRLSGAGLSITEWKPFSGALPPLNASDWAGAFAQYKASPQYRIENQGMSLGDFQYIFWWEWSHRQLGRIIGLVWGLGFLFFWLSGRIPTGWTRRLLLLGLLGGIQGAIGWWMVSSGLTGRMIAVASYRLATHLGIGFIILGFTAWFMFQMGRAEGDLLQSRRQREDWLYRLASVVMVLLFVQVLLGALVAGIDAGRNYPTWPLMNGHFFPEDAFTIANGPAWRAFFENAGLVQFVHRMTGYLVFLTGLFVWFRASKSAHLATRRAFDLMALMLVAQVTLGVFTALYAAPLHLAIVHQLGAVVLWVLVLRARHNARYPQVGSIRKGTA